LDGATYVGVSRDADIFIKLALRAGDLDGAHDLRFLHAPQHERRHARAQGGELLGAFFTLRGRAESGAKLLGAAEQPGHQKLEDRPQLFETVFDGSAREAEAVLGSERTDDARDQAATVFDHLGFVEDEVIKALVLKER
jgi:hypothetical protein